MKLSKTSWLLITIGVLVITFASLGAVRAQQIHRQNQLNEELTLTELKLKGVQLEQLSQQQEELETRLNEATSQFEAVKAILSQPRGSVATSGILFDVAEACGVEVTDISSSGLSSDELEGVPCSVLILTASVEGDVLDLVSFITELNAYLSTGVVQSVSINVPETTSNEKSTANIRLVVYMYQGS